MRSTRAIRDWNDSSPSTRARRGIGPRPCPDRILQRMPESRLERRAITARDDPRLPAVAGDLGGAAGRRCHDRDSRRPLPRARHWACLRNQTTGRTGRGRDGHVRCRSDGRAGGVAGRARLPAPVVRGRARALPSPAITNVVSGRSFATRANTSISSVKFFCGSRRPTVPMTRPSVGRPRAARARASRERSRANAFGSMAFSTTSMRSARAPADSSACLISLDTASTLGCRAISHLSNG